MNPCPSLGSFRPSLLQLIVGSGTPVAVQEMTTGDSVVTAISAVSSAMEGGTTRAGTSRTIMLWDRNVYLAIH